MNVSRFWVRIACGHVKRTLTSWGGDWFGYCAMAAVTALLFVLLGELHLDGILDTNAEFLRFVF
jgi:cobalamin synthase